MSKKIQILIITPVFILSATFSCILFAKLDREHKAKLVADAQIEEVVALKGLDKKTQDQVREVVCQIASLSSFSFVWNKQYARNIDLLLTEDVSGFDLMTFLLTDKEISNQMLLVKNHKKQYSRLLGVVSQSLVKEYESGHFFERAKRFARCLGLEEDMVLKLLKEGVESLKYDSDLIAIEALLDCLEDAMHASSHYSCSLL